MRGGRDLDALGKFVRRRHRRRRPRLLLFRQFPEQKTSIQVVVHEQQTLGTFSFENVACSEMSFCRRPYPPLFSVSVFEAMYILYQAVSIVQQQVVIGVGQS